MKSDLDTIGDALFAAIAADDSLAIQSIVASHPHALQCRHRLLDHAPPLHFAASRGKPAALKTLLDMGGDPNDPRGTIFMHERDAFYTPLHEASGGGHVDVASTLLASGAFVDAHPSSWTTPLRSVVIRGNLELVTLLVRGGADIDAEGSAEWSGTLLDEAVGAQFLGKGQQAVADYLRAEGAVLGYSEWHNWAKPQVELIERNVGVVHPRPTGRQLGKTWVSVYKARFAPRKFLHQLLFTEGLAPFVHAELGIVLPTRWPLNRNALVERRFAWPQEMLFHLGEAVANGAQIVHGDVLRAGDERLRGFDSPIPEWIVARSDVVETARSGAPGTVPLLLLTPVVTKKRYKGGKDAMAEADKRAAQKWERLHVPLPDLTPIGFEGSL